MAKGWRKDDYNRQIFGQKVKEYRVTLEWSLGQLAERSDINKGTLLHVEQGICNLPTSKRQNVIEILSDTLETLGQPINRQELLSIAGLSTTSTDAKSSLSPQHGPTPETHSQKQACGKQSHEQDAEELNRQHRWQEAAAFWLLAAHEARQTGKWSTWSRCLIRAGLMALTMGQYELAERRFKEVINMPQQFAGTFAVIDAYIRLGWLYYEQDKFSLARHVLLKCGSLLQNVANQSSQLSRFLEHGGVIVYEDNRVLLALESARLHWLGRTYVDWGMQQDNQTLIQEGIMKLQKARQYDSKLDALENVGFEMLRQVPALVYQDDLTTAERYVAQCEELFGNTKIEKGHLSFHKGLILLEEQPKKARDFLESACENFDQPPFYSKGVSETFKELASIHSLENKKTGDEKALEYALATVVLHPYKRNVEILQLTTHKMYWRLGESSAAFNTHWQMLKEKLWRMESEPFASLRSFIQIFQERGVRHIESALEIAEQAIQNELFRM